MNANSTLPALPSRVLRRSDAATLMRVLEDQQARKLDVVVPGYQVYSRNGCLSLTGLTDPAITEDGVYDLNGAYTFTDSAVADLATDHDIPLPYLRRCRTTNIRAFDHTINDWTRYDEDRNVLIRLLWGSDRAHPGTNGIVRAVLSDAYGVRDNLDMATAFLAGLRAAGVDSTQIVEADLTDNNLYMRVAAPQIAIRAPELLRDYRSPFTGQPGSECPIVFAGVVFCNSETGHGRTRVSPQIRIKVCDNGMTLTRQALTQVHRGARLAPGTVRWRRDTCEADDRAFTLKIRDAVAAFLTPEFLQDRVDEITEAATTKLTAPETTLTVVSTKLRFTKEERTGIWSHFLAAGDRSAGGIMHAVTSFAQVVGDRGDVERSHELTALGLDALNLAAAHA